MEAAATDGTTMFAMSSPSSASIAMIAPTSTPDVPFWTYSTTEVSSRSAEKVGIGRCSTPSSSAQRPLLPAELSVRGPAQHQLDPNWETRVQVLTTILPMMPSSCASTSMLALSVSMPSRTSPATKLSPSLNFHSLTLPSVIVGERAGIVSGVTWRAGRVVETVGGGGLATEAAARARRAGRTGSAGPRGASHEGGEARGEHAATAGGVVRIGRSRADLTFWCRWPQRGSVACRPSFLKLGPLSRLCAGSLGFDTL